MSGQDRQQAEQFIEALTGSSRTPVSFQTFDDNKRRGNDALIRILHGTLDAHWDSLVALNDRGAGIFVTVNETDLTGRTQANITRVRALYVEFDPPKTAAAPGFFALEPSILIESSPGKHHVYWRVLDQPELTAFQAMQKALIRRLGSDPAVDTVERVMRVPGFLHSKAEPYMTRLLAVNPTAIYPSAEIVRRLGKLDENGAPVGSGRQGGDEVDEWGTGRGNMPPDRLECTPENVSIVLEILRVAGYSPDDSRDIWSRVCWSVMDLDEGAPGGWVNVVRKWSMESEKFTEAGFENVAGSYRPGKSGIRHIANRAKANGYTGSEPWQVTVVTVAPEPEAPPMRLELDDSLRGDIATGSVFGQIYRRRLLRIAGLNEWMTFDRDTGWTMAPPGIELQAGRGAVKVLQQMASDRLRKLDGQEMDARTKYILGLVNSAADLRGMKRMIEMGSSEPGMMVHASELDADPYLLGLTNGIMELKSGNLRKFTSERLVSKRCNVAFDPSAQCPQWMQFLQEVLPDKEVRRFLRTFFGCCLLGRVNHEGFLFLHGPGANGKSIFIETISWVLGDYARSIPTEMLMRQQRSSQGPSADIIDLMGRRLVYANETEEGQRMAESSLKRLTGGDKLSGRVPYAKTPINFEPSHKLVIVGNHKPLIHDDGNAMWRRVALVGFDVTIPEAQRKPREVLMGAFRQEGAGILNWLLVGLNTYQREGLKAPTAVQAATRAYKDEMDVLGDWLSECCTLAPDARQRQAELFKNYEFWAKGNGYKPMSKTRLTQRLKDRGITASSDRRHYLGVSIRQHEWAARAA